MVEFLGRVVGFSFCFFFPFFLRDGWGRFMKKDVGLVGVVEYFLIS